VDIGPIDQDSRLLHVFLAIRRLSQFVDLSIKISFRRRTCTNIEDMKCPYSPERQTTCFAPHSP
jgi:hypothetical protein